jgi:hypothetical protein
MPSVGVGGSLRPALSAGQEAQLQQARDCFGLASLGFGLTRKICHFEKWHYQSLTHFAIGRITPVIRAPNQTRPGEDL